MHDNSTGMLIARSKFSKTIILTLYSLAYKVEWSKNYSFEFKFRYINIFESYGKQFTRKKEFDIIITTFLKWCKNLNKFIIIRKMGASILGESFYIK